MTSVSQKAVLMLRRLFCFFRIALAIHSLPVGNMLDIRLDP
ncbi:hypothetical protein ATH33_2551 [Thermoactinomyces vulgaris]|nr:hypothetical protein ATH33_2551 [Thermoactinomyces vulgaris]